MPNPIFIIFEYHQVTAGEQLLQANLESLAAMGYRTYLDEEAHGTSFESKLSMQTDAVIKAQDIPEENPGYWQKEVVETRLKTLTQMQEFGFNYFPYDLSAAEMMTLSFAHMDIIQDHPEGLVQGFNELASGKNKDYMEIFNARVEKQNLRFAEQVAQCQDGIVCVAGVYHAKHLQNHLRAQFPEQDILCYFPYQGAPFEAFEETARNQESNTEVFPTHAKLIDFDTLEAGGTEVIHRDVAHYHSMISQLNTTFDDLFSMKHHTDEALIAFKEQLFSCQNTLLELSGLNNKDYYQFKINIGLSQCALLDNKLDDVKQYYNAAKAIVRDIPRSPAKTALIQSLKSIANQFKRARHQETENLESSKPQSTPFTMFQPITTSTTSSNEIRAAEAGNSHAPTQAL